MMADFDLAVTLPHNFAAPDLQTNLIEELLEGAIPFFKHELVSRMSSKPLNEDELTQIFMSKAQILIRHRDLPFNLANQYRDIINPNKGITDLFFYPNEMSQFTNSIYSVECKRLPAPAKSRAKEYVIGVKANGGIERFKKEIHGAGLQRCGLIGFVEKGHSLSWATKINEWIIELCSLSADWQRDEMLLVKKNRTDFSTFSSIAHRSKSNIHLHHILIDFESDPKL